MDYEKYTTESFNLTQEEQKEITIILSKQKVNLLMRLRLKMVKHYPKSKQRY